MYRQSSRQIRGDGLEIVINIEESLYNTIMCSPDSPTLGWYAIAHGKVLPKGHGDLIDRNALITELETDYHGTLTESGAHLFVGITNYIDDAETIIEADKESNDGTDN